MRLRSFIFCFFVATAAWLPAQELFKKNHLVDIELEADEYFEGYAYKAALEQYLELQALDSTSQTKEIDFKIGVCYLETYGYQDALYYLQRASSAVGETPTSFAYYLAKAYQLNGLVEEAIIAYNDYLLQITGNEDLVKYTQEVEREIQNCETAKGFYAAPVDVHVKLMSRSINSVYDDYDPLIEADRSVMYFTSDRPHQKVGAVHEMDGTAYEDIYRSFKTDTGWTAAQKVEELDVDHDNACVALSHDGHKMILYRYQSTSFWKKPSGHLYSTELVGGKWTSPKVLPFSESAASNEISACFSIDDKTIYFSSDREGGFGGKDIYKVVFEKGEWSTPINLGANINTALDEDSPFVHPDGERFYFSSQGHKNMGGYDVFVSKISDGGFSLPANLGYPVNTTTDEISFVIGADGKKAYVADNREGGYGEMDVYEMEFFDEEDDVMVFKGKVISTEGVPIDAIINVYEEDGSTLHSVYHTNPSTGQFVMMLHEGGKFKLELSKKGFQLYSEWVDLQKEEGYHEVLHDIVLQKN